MPNQVYKLSSHLLCLPTSLLDSVLFCLAFLMNLMFFFISLKKKICIYLFKVKTHRPYFLLTMIVL